MFSPEVGEINTHVQTVCTRPSPLPILESLGTRLFTVHVLEDDTVLWNNFPIYICRAGLPQTKGFFVEPEVTFKEVEAFF